MHQIGQVIIADDVWETRFACDLSSCKGSCCAIGDRGTPIDQEEAEKLAIIFPRIQDRLPRASVQFLKTGITESHKGSLYIRETGHNAPCPFAFRGEGNILYCSVHAYCIEENLPVTRWKPYWCCLFPFVLQKSGDQWFLNQYIAPHCCSVRNAPLLLDWGAPLLGEFLGDAWRAELEKELDNAFGSSRVRHA